MVQDIEKKITEQLEQLERKGQQFLRKRNGVSALMRARDVILPGLPLLAAIALTACMLLHVLATLAILVMIAVALILYGLLSGYWWFTAQADRKTALALFDTQLASGDRILTADEFVHHNNRSRFEDAALIESQPWLDTALNTSLPDKAPAYRYRRRAWPYLLPTIGLLLAVFVVSQRPLNSQPIHPLGNPRNTTQQEAWSQLKPTGTQQQSPALQHKTVNHTDDHHTATPIMDTEEKTQTAATPAIHRQAEADLNNNPAAGAGDTTLVAQQNGQTQTPAPMLGGNNNGSVTASAQEKNTRSAMHTAATPSPAQPAKAPQQPH